MHIGLFGVRIRQNYFHPCMLAALSIICIIGSLASLGLINVNRAHINKGPKPTSQGHTRIAPAQIGNSALIDRTSLLWQSKEQLLLPLPSAQTVAYRNYASPSGQDMPSGNTPGWKQIFAEDFNTNVTVGNFPGTAYGSQFKVYPDGTPDTEGQRRAPSRYYPSKVVSVNNGLLNLYLHTENGTPMAAAILPILSNHLYGKYTIRFRSDALEGFKTAWLLWPDSEKWPRDGEIDFPEGPLNGTISAFMHRQNGTSGKDQDVYNTRTTYISWHTASIEWSPSSVKFILDNQLIGTSTNRIPNTPMHWVIQTESCLPTCPAPTTAGNLQIDWVVAYALT